MIKTFKIPEIKYILIFTIILTILVQISSVYYNFNIGIDYGLYLGVISSLIGFLFTALSILIVFPEKGKIVKLEKHELYPFLSKIFLLTIFSLLLLLIDLIIGNLWGEHIYFQKVIFLFLLIFSMMLILLDLWIFKRMIDLLFKR